MSEKILSGDFPRFREAARPEDLHEVGRLVRATGFFSEEEIGIAVELVGERLAKGDTSGYSFLFAEDVERLTGYACFGRIPGTVHSYDLYWIAVDPGFQGKGVGRRVMEGAEAIILRDGGRLVYADTSSRSQYEPTRRFYVSCGYHQAAFLPDFYAPGDGKVIYMKSLPFIP